MSGPIHLTLTDEKRDALLPAPSSAPAPRASSSSKAKLAKGAVGLLALASLGYQFAPAHSFHRCGSAGMKGWKESRALSGYLHKVAAGLDNQGLGLPVLTNKAAENIFLTVPEAESARAASHS